MNTASTLLTLKDIEAAALRLEGVANHTPVLTSRTLDAIAGARVYLKCENFQRVGAFKFRGAYNAIAKRLEKEPELHTKGVVAVSSGNHSQGVALAAKLLEIPCTIYMPKDAPQTKIEATQFYGATVKFFDRYNEDRDQIVAKLLEEGAALIHGYDDLDVIAGQGTAAYELMQEVPDLDLVMSPLGGGGLLSGTMIAARGLKPNIKVYGVEPEVANDWDLSFKAGKRVSIDAPQTIADGVALCTPGKITYDILHDNLDGVILISEQEIRDAVNFALQRLKIVIEPSSALVLAALLNHKVDLSGINKIGLIISGGNVDLRFV